MEGVMRRRGYSSSGSSSSSSTLSRRRAGGLLMLVVGTLGLLGQRMGGGVSAELVQVQVVARAGARKWISYTKPRREYGAGLLPAGFEEMEQVGKLLKARYLGPTAEVPLANVTEVYKNGDALLRAQARDQTASSADALAYGMWSPLVAADQTKAAPLTGGYQAVPVFTISRGMDYLLSGSTACPAIDDHTETFFTSPVFKAKAAETEAIRTQLGQKLNMSADLQDMFSMYDRVVLSVRFDDNPSGGEILPALTPAEFTQLKAMADFVEAGKFGDPGVGFLCGGPLLSEIFDRMAAMASQAEHRSRPFLLYMGSHATINCALSALKPTDRKLLNHVHNHGSLLVFELHAVAGEYYVNTLFLEGETAQFTRVFFGANPDGACGEKGLLCPLPEAKRILSGRMEPNLLEWCDKCANSFMMPACIQSLQVKMSAAMKDDESRSSKRQRRTHTAGALFIGLFAGAFVALAVSALGPMLRRRWAERGGRAYSDTLDREGGGIEAPTTRGGAV